MTLSDLEYLKKERPNGKVTVAHY